MTDDTNPLAGFAGWARLFPLPNLVMFPHVMQPLRIFEPRYREMTADALGGDHLITPVLLRPGWKSNYEGNPPLHSIACLGRIVADQRLEDGRFNLLLRGLCRARIIEEQHSDKLYRTARVELLADDEMVDGQSSQAYRQQLTAALAGWFTDQPAVLDQFQKLCQGNLALGVLADIVAFALPVPVEAKQELLQQTDVEARVVRLLKLMKRDGAGRRFPPEFSTN